MMPLIVIALMFVVQVGLAYHARQVVSGAAQDGAASGAVEGSSASEGAATAQSLIEGVGREPAERAVRQRVAVR